MLCYRRQACLQHLRWGHKQTRYGKREYNAGDGLHYAPSAYNDIIDYIIHHPVPGVSDEGEYKVKYVKPNKDYTNIVKKVVENPEVQEGWQPAKDRIIFSTTGYTTKTEKTAVSTVEGQTKFQIKDAVEKLYDLLAFLGCCDAGVGNINIIFEYLLELSAHERMN